MHAAYKRLGIRVTFSNMWSMIRGRAGRHERKGETQFFVGGKIIEGGHPTKRETLSPVSPS